MAWTAILSGDGANVPGVSLEVRLCSPLQLVTLLVGASLDYPLLLRLALPNTLHARISSVSFCIYFYEFISDYVYVQNLPRNK